MAVVSRLVIFVTLLTNLYSILHPTLSFTGAAAASATCSTCQTPHGDHAFTTAASSDDDISATTACLPLESPKDQICTALALRDAFFNPTGAVRTISQLPQPVNERDILPFPAVSDVCFDSGLLNPIISQKLVTASTDSTSDYVDPIEFHTRFMSLIDTPIFASYSDLPFSFLVGEGEDLFSDIDDEHELASHSYSLDGQRLIHEVISHSREEQEVVCDGQPSEKQGLIDDIANAVCHVREEPLEYQSLDAVCPVREEPLEYQSLDAVCHVREEPLENRPLEDSEVTSADTNFILELANAEIKLPSRIEHMVSCTYEGLRSGKFPMMTPEGSSGAYFMLDSEDLKIAVFKPIDEEPLGINNPREQSEPKDGEGLKRGTRVGEGAYREVAAYILDHPKNHRRTSYDQEEGFAGVPPTILIKCLHEGFCNPDDLATVKIGSLQMFVKNVGSCEDYGSKSFSNEEVHKISILDIRLANADRHAGNILVSTEDGRTVLVPIDHGYCLPETFEDCCFDWLNWRQAKEPFSAETARYIESLDAEQDIRLLKSVGWDIPPKAARVLRISTTLLRKGVEKGLSAFDLGDVMCRIRSEEKSVIEEVVEEAANIVDPNQSEDAFLEMLSHILDQRLDKIQRGKEEHK